MTEKMANKRAYHTRRWRSTCIGAGHIHCEENGCDNAIALGRSDLEEYEVYDRIYGYTPIRCQGCYRRVHQTEEE